MKKFALLLGCLPLLMLSCSKESVKEPVTVSFGVEVSVTDSSASVVVTPSDVEVPYYCDVLPPMNTRLREGRLRMPGTASSGNTGPAG